MQRARKHPPIDRLLACATVLALLLQCPAFAASPAPLERRCEKIEQRIAWINSRLRAGYRVAEGERWKEQLRRLKAERKRRCR